MLYEEIQKIVDDIDKIVDNDTNKEFNTKLHYIIDDIYNKGFQNGHRQGVQQIKEAVITSLNFIK